jgi:hypothetical protein
MIRLATTFRRNSDISGAVMRRLAPRFQLFSFFDGLDTVLLFQTRSNTVQDQRIRKKTIQH